ncbi:MAG TPA: hypothetical protein VNB78_10620 [Sphingomicrobium sp.]|jgi:hypothetical protein|nr:hypothetical protein [Sphingomicrobium sp.]
MRKKRSLETDEQRSERLIASIHGRLRRASAEADALDEAVRRSIKLHGA